MGIVAPQADPELAVRLFRSSGRLYATVEVRDAVNPQVLKLIQAGNSVLLELSVDGPIGDDRSTFTHRIGFDPIHRVYTVEIEESSARHRTTDQAVAFDIYGRFYALDLAPVRDLGFPAKIDIQARLTTAAPVGFDTGVLWNYRSPRVRIGFSGLSDYRSVPEKAR